MTDVKVGIILLLTFTFSFQLLDYDTIIEDGIYSKTYDSIAKEEASKKDKK